MKYATQEEGMAVLNRQVADGKITRRHFAKLAAMLAAGAPFVVKSETAFGQETKELVLVNWGGDATPAYEKAYGAPFKAETGITLKQDTSGPTDGAIQAQAATGRPSWDLLDTDPWVGTRFGKLGQMEPIDYSIVDKSKMREGFGWEYAASTYFFSYVIVYDSAKYGDKAPTGMKDFFDVEKFPGKRLMFKWGNAMWEAALMADGVPRDQLYPLDIERANKKIEAFKENVSSYWGGGAESQSIMLNGDASMGIIWSTRASLLEADTGGQFKFIWDDGLISPGSLLVMKNNPGGKDAAMKFLASMQDPQKQVAMFELLGQGPGNPAADALLPDDKRRLNPVDPENAAKQVPLNNQWYTDHYEAALDQYLKIISG